MKIRSVLRGCLRRVLFWRGRVRSWFRPAPGIWVAEAEPVPPSDLPESAPLAGALRELDESARRSRDACLIRLRARLPGRACMAGLMEADRAALLDVLGIWRGRALPSSSVSPVLWQSLPGPCDMDAAGARCAPERAASGMAQPAPPADST